MSNATAKRRLDETEEFDTWPEPRKLPSGLLSVPDFDLSLLPSPFEPWVADIADRMQVPPEFVAVPAMVAAGSVIGRKIGIRPQVHTDWTEVPNLWGCIIGRPGVMKSPAIQQALAPLHRLQDAARVSHEVSLKNFEAGELERELRESAWKVEMKKRLKGDPKANTDDLQFVEEEAPTLHRYVVNDTSYQCLGELLIENPNGLLVHRDELISLLKTLEREENAEARSFYLTGWNGDHSYMFDRIIRGKNLHVPSLTLSMMGSTQPGRLKSFLSAALRGGASDDGMIQRFSMMVWPDMPTAWIDRDREPDHRAKQAALEAFKRLDSMTPESVHAQRDDATDKGGFLRLEGEGLEAFLEWRYSHELKVRSGELHPAMESHLSKYRTLIPALALIHHLANGERGAVGVLSVLSAIYWGDFLESHAHRIYSAASNAGVDSARELIRHIRKGDLGPQFSARDVQRKGWSGLTDITSVQEALELLADHDWIKSRAIPAGPDGGRPTFFHTANPKTYIERCAI